MKRFLIVIEKADGNYSAHAPDVPGCITVGDTVEETKQNMREALEFHFEGMREDGDSIPEPSTLADYVDVEVPEPAKRKAR